MTAQDLKSACDKVLADPELQPRVTDGGLVTFCNIGAERIAEAMGCTDLCAMMADEQYNHMDGGGNWTKVNGSDAALHALAGDLVFAAMPSSRLKESHGHIAAIYPEEMEMSGSLGHPVPLCANIGAHVGVLKSSEAFPVACGEAEYFCYKKEQIQ